MNKGNGFGREYVKPRMVFVWECEPGDKVLIPSPPMLPNTEGVIREIKKIEREGGRNYSVTVNSAYNGDKISLGSVKLELIG